jgi:hypothetical protein
MSDITAVIDCIEVPFDREKLSYYAPFLGNILGWKELGGRTQFERYEKVEFELPSGKKIKAYSAWFFSDTESAWCIKFGKSKGPYINTSLFNDWMEIDQDHRQVLLGYGAQSRKDMELLCYSLERTVFVPHPSFKNRK